MLTAPLLSSCISDSKLRIGESTMIRESRTVIMTQARVSVKTLLQLITERLAEVEVAPIFFLLY